MGSVQQLKTEFETFLPKCGPAPKRLLKFVVTGFTIVIFLASPSDSASLNSEECDSAYFFRCVETGKCIPLAHVCNNKMDCSNDGSDFSDEQICKENNGFNEKNQFQAIISKSLNDSYYKALTGPIKEKELEYLIDYKAEDKNILERHRNFNSDKIMEALTRKALYSNTSADQFHEEMIQLLAPYYPDNQLVQKYDVRSDAGSEDPNSPTIFRLRMMFPHYCDLEHKPFHAAKRVNVAGQFEAPVMLQYPEFGGLIPRSNDLFANKPTTRNTLISLHLFLLSREKDEHVSHRIRCLTLKDRIEKSMLSDKRRMRLLQNNDILGESTNIGECFVCNGKNSEVEPCIPDVFLKGCDQYF